MFYKKLARKPDDDGYELVKVVERMYARCEADFDVKRCEFGRAWLDYEERKRQLRRRTP